LIKKFRGYRQRRLVRYLDLFDNGEVRCFATVKDYNDAFVRAEVGTHPVMGTWDSTFPLIYEIMDADSIEFFSGFVRASSCSTIDARNWWPGHGRVTIGCEADLAILRMML